MFTEIVRDCQVKLLKDVLELWKVEVEKKPPEMSVDDAYEALELTRGQHHEDAVVRKAYYRLAQIYHPDKNPEGKVSVQLISNFEHTRILTFSFVSITDKTFLNRILKCGGCFVYLVQLKISRFCTYEVKIRSRYEGLYSSIWEFR